VRFIQSFFTIPVAAAEFLQDNAAPPCAIPLPTSFFKLLHIVYGVLKTQKPFDPDYLKKYEKNA
jgi:hypothetical protein